MATFVEITSRKTNAFGVGDKVWLTHNGVLVAATVSRIEKGELVYIIGRTEYTCTGNVYKRLVTDGKENIRIP